MLKSLPPDLANLLESVSLDFSLQQFLTNDTPAVQNWHVSAAVDHWGQGSGGDVQEVIGHIDLAKGLADSPIVARPVGLVGLVGW